MEGIFLSIKDLQKLEGSSYPSAHRHHQALRDALSKRKQVTIKEYCSFEGLDFDYIWEYLRGKNRK
jgi:hypothetical protein